MKLTLYQIDAFADRMFTGNQACVVPLDAWLDDATLQSIAAENNVAETAFFVPTDTGYHLRWCTPTIEVDLCGHATLAAAYVIFTHLRSELQQISFDTRSGIVTVERDADRLVLDFPSRPGLSEPVTAEIVEALGLAPRAVLRSRDLMCVFDSAEQVRRLQPDMSRVARLKCLGVIVTAPGDEPGVDFVSRFFAPQSGIPEDPATGSAHCTLTPYWSARLGRAQLHARQLSSRGAELWLTQCGERVRIAGRAVQYLHGTIDV